MEIIFMTETIKNDATSDFGIRIIITMPVFKGVQKLSEIQEITLRSHFYYSTEM